MIDILCCDMYKKNLVSSKITCNATNTSKSHRFPNAEYEIAFGNLTKVRHDFCHPKIMPVTDAEFLMKFGIL